MKGFATIQDLVMETLEQHPETRDSDYLLYIRVCDACNSTAASKPFGYVMKYRKALGLPDFESVGRTRRKVQELRPDLRATKETTDGRYKNWKEAREYAFGDKV